MHAHRSNWQQADKADTFSHHSVAFVDMIGSAFQLHTNK